MMSMGHKYKLVMASAAKWCLQADMDPQQRLFFLNHLEKMVDGTITPAIIALIEPIDKKGVELCLEVLKLGFESKWDGLNGRHLPNAFDVLSQRFDVFAALNPSLQHAYDEACRPWQKESMQ
jgi:hypothetical protein